MSLLQMGLEIRLLFAPELAVGYSADERRFFSALVLSVSIHVCSVSIRFMAQVAHVPSRHLVVIFHVVPYNHGVELVYFIYFFYAPIFYNF